MDTHIVSGLNINEIYLNLLERLVESTEISYPRNYKVHVLPFTVVKILPDVGTLITLRARRLNPVFLFAELLWILSGQNDLASIAFYNSKMRDFSDDNLTLNGAYGARLRNWQGIDQFQRIIDILTVDINSRQAILQIFNPTFDYNSKDIPCNNLLHFQVRNGQLDLSVFVRSQDIFLGFPYDIFHWKTLQEIFASILHLKVGTYYHIMDNLHMYATDLLKVEAILNDRTILNTANENTLLSNVKSFDDFNDILCFLSHNFLLQNSFNESHLTLSIYTRICNSVLFSNMLYILYLYNLRRRNMRHISSFDPYSSMNLTLRLMYENFFEVDKNTLETINVSEKTY